jgi:hypothetical protein
LMCPRIDPGTGTDEFRSRRWAILLKNKSTADSTGAVLRIRIRDPESGAYYPLDPGSVIRDEQIFGTGIKYPGSATLY